MNRETGFIKRVDTYDQQTMAHTVTRQAPPAAPPTGAAKGRKRKGGGRFPTDMKDILKAISKAPGWELTRAGGGQAAISPTGKKIILPTRSNVLPRNVMNACKRLEHEGLDLRHAN